MSITLKIHPRKDHHKNDGSSNLYLWLTINRKVKKYGLKHFVDISKWDWKNNTVRGNTKLVMQQNAFIANKLNEIHSFILNREHQGLPVTFESIEMFLNGQDPQDFYQFFIQYIEKNKVRLSSLYVKQMKGEMSKLKKFREHLTFKEINHEFLRDYEYYMRNTLKNSTNTVTKSFKKIRTVINEAMKINEMLYTKSPFKTYTLRTEPTSRAYLTIEEYEQLNAIKDELNSSEANVLGYFLFSCRTGLRYYDIHQLKARSIYPDYVEVVMHKTKDTVVIPIYEKTRALLPDLSTMKPDDKVFRVVSNQKTNEILKKIVAKAGIDKNITFHCARHTFATIALNLGIPIEVLQKILGHSMVKTTQIYGKIVNKTVFEQMKKFG